MSSIEKTHENKVMVLKLVRLYKELTVAKGYVADVLGALKKWTPETMSYTTHISKPFIKEMPKFKIMEKEAEEVKKLLRRVCTEELPIEKAIPFFEKMEKEIEEVLGMVNTQKIKPYLDKEQLDL